MAPYVPVRNDVFEVRAILGRFRLPNELILSILDEARYWTEATYNVMEHRVLLDEEWNLDYSAAFLYLMAPAFRGGLVTSATLEVPKIREIEFTIVSHDQGWTTEDTEGTYDSSSWFEVSILRPTAAVYLRLVHVQKPIATNIYTATSRLLQRQRKTGVTLVPRPSADIEPQRRHCPEMTNMTSLIEEGPHDKPTEHRVEGEHAWYLQSNQVARGVSVFEGEMIRRYRVVWGCKANPVWAGNEGAGSGAEFLDTLKQTDWICVWARAKRRGWENHIHGVRMKMSYTI